MSFRVSMYASFDPDDPDLIGCLGFNNFDTLDEACDFIKTDSVFRRCPIIKIERGVSDLFSPFVPSTNFL